MPSFLHVRDHWSVSKPGDPEGRVVLSELGHGDSPVVCGQRCLNFVLDGVERYEIGGRTLTVRPGEFIFVEAGTTARVMLPQRQVTRGLCVYLPDPAGEHAPTAFGDAFQLATADGVLSKQLRQITLRLAQTPELDPLNTTDIVRSVMVGFERLEAELTPRLSLVEAARPATRQQLLQKVERARRYLHDQPSRIVPLSELAQAVAMSPFHLARSFKGVFGRPPAEYHRRLRLELVAAEMRQRDVSISEMAAKFGFADASSLSRAHRRTLGWSPSQQANGDPLRKTVENSK